MSTCFGIAVDVNGLTRGPNKTDEQRGSLTSSRKLKKLTADRYYIYLSSDGIAKGHPSVTLIGRLITGEK